MKSGKLIALAICFPLMVTAQPIDRVQVSPSPSRSYGVFFSESEIVGTKLFFRLANSTNRYLEVDYQVEYLDGSISEEMELGLLSPHDPPLISLIYVYDAFVGSWADIDQVEQVIDAYELRPGDYTSLPSEHKPPFGVNIEDVRRVIVKCYGLGSGLSNMSDRELDRVMLASIPQIVFNLVGKSLDLNSNRFSRGSGSIDRDPEMRGRSRNDIIRRYMIDVLNSNVSRSTYEELYQKLRNGDLWEYSSTLSSAYYDAFISYSKANPRRFKDLLVAMGVPRDELSFINARNVGDLFRLLDYLDFVDNVYGFITAIGSSTLFPAVLTFEYNFDKADPTLYLIDVSGSMGGGKITQATQAAYQSVASIESQYANTPTQPDVAVLTFSGGCSPSSTRSVLGFTPDLDQAKALFERGLGTGGGTPSPQALEVATQQMQAYLTANPSVQQGRIIMMSDGQSSCGAIRPPGVFSQSTTTVSAPSTTGSSTSSSSTASPLMSTATGGAPLPPVQYLTVGFDIPPGSPAERDLQYLASSTGGRYFNAQNGPQLARAFRKLARVFRPKPIPDAYRLPEEQRALLDTGRAALRVSDFGSARAAYASFAEILPDEPAALYNLALALEGHDRYKGAAATYRQYLAAAPDAPEAEDLRQRIALLEQDYRDHYTYLTALVASDLVYLQDYYQRLFNRSNAALSDEFAGFIREKGPFYEDLTDALEVENSALDRAAEDLALTLERLARRVGTPTFDRDAVSLLTLPIAHLEEIARLLGTAE